MPRVFLGLGSNLGNRESNLREALRRLRDAVEIDGVSSVYDTAPIGHADQPRFWNLVVSGRTELEPTDVLAATQRIERELGRAPSFRNAPRPIDIDLLLYDDVVLEIPELVLPHPRLRERAFVLRPLAELAPELRHSVTGERFSELAAATPGDAVPLFAGEQLR